MGDDASLDQGGDPVKRFIEELSSDQLSDTSSSRRPRQAIKIATDAKLRARLVHLLKERADWSLRRSVVDALEEVGDDLDSHVDSTSATIELLDRSALPVVTAAMLSGIGLLVGTGARANSIALVVCGAAGLVIAGLGRNRLKAYESRVRIVAKKIRRLVAEIGSNDEPSVRQQHRVIRRRCRGAFLVRRSRRLCCYENSTAPSRPRLAALRGSATPIRNLPASFTLR